MFARNGQICIRAIEPGDAQVVYLWENDATVWLHSDNLLPYSQFQVEQFILEGHDIYRNRQLRFMIDLDENNQLKTIGMLDLYDFHPHHKRAGVGIYVAKDYRNQGYGKNALKLLVEYAFDVLQLHQLYCTILTHNLHSFQLFTKLGFEHTATYKQWIFYGGKYYDQMLLQLFNPNKETP